MNSKAWGRVFRITLVIMGILSVLSVANMIASGNGAAFLPDIVRRCIGIVNMICLFLCVFARVKGR